MPQLLDRIANAPSAQFLPGLRHERLLVVFSGRPAGYTYPHVWACRRDLSACSFDRLILRDTFGQWYLRGQEGLTDSLAQTLEVIAELVAARGHRSVTSLGLSAGSFAALLTAPQLAPEAVVCAGCRTSLRPRDRRATTKPGSQLRKDLERLWACEEIDETALDAAATLAALGTEAPPVHIHFDPSAERDASSARLIEDLPTVRLFRHPGLGHDIAPLLSQIFKSDPILGGTATHTPPHRPPTSGGAFLAKVLRRKAIATDPLR